MSTSTLEKNIQARSAKPKSLVVSMRSFEALQLELVSSRAREEFLLSTVREQSARHEVLAQEFEHRLVNGLQLISSLLSMQARTACSAEVASQLTIASRRVASLGRVHHRLHQSDQQDMVEFGSYLRHLCDDLSNLLFEGRTDYSVDVESASADIPGKFALPLGFIVNELVTNAAKYARGRIAVRFEETDVGYSLSVEDDGPGVPPGFDPSRSKGLGMRIVLALVKQIEGELRISPRDNGQGARFAVRFEAAPV